MTTHPNARKSHSNELKCCVHYRYCCTFVSVPEAPPVDAKLLLLRVDIGEHARERGRGVIRELEGHLRTNVA